MSASKTIQPQSTVQIHYTLSTDDVVLESSEGRDPLELALGSGKLHPALEAQLVGRKEGESFDIFLDASLAFGERNNDLHIRIARRKVPESVSQLPEGASFESLDPDGKKRLFRVLKGSETTFEIDGNHPLAGENLHFEGQVVRIL